MLRLGQCSAILGVYKHRSWPSYTVLGCLVYVAGAALQSWLTLHRPFVGDMQSEAALPPSAAPAASAAPVAKPAVPERDSSPAARPGGGMGGSAPTAAVDDGWAGDGGLDDMMEDLNSGGYFVPGKWSATCARAHTGECQCKTGCPETSCLIPFNIA